MFFFYSLYSLISISIILLLLLYCRFFLIRSSFFITSGCRLMFILFCVMLFSLLPTFIFIGFSTGLNTDLKFISSSSFIYINSLHLFVDKYLYLFVYSYVALIGKGFLIWGCEVKKEMGNIDKVVDTLLVSNGKLKADSFRTTKKISKVAIVAIVTVAVATASIGVAFNYYMVATSGISQGRLWEIKDNIGGSWSAYEEMGNTDLSFDIDTVGGNVEFFNFSIKLSGNSQASKPIYFTATNNYQLDGINLTVQNKTHGFEVNDQSPVDCFTFNPGDEIGFDFIVSSDEYTPEGSYQVVLELEKN